MATQMRIISHFLKQKTIVFSQIEECITHFTSKFDTTCSSNQTVLFQMTF